MRWGGGVERAPAQRTQCVGETRPSLHIHPPTPKSRHSSPPHTHPPSRPSSSTQAPRSLTHQIPVPHRLEDARGRHFSLPCDIGGCVDRYMLVRWPGPASCLRAIAPCCCQQQAGPHALPVLSTAAVAATQRNPPPPARTHLKGIYGRPWWPDDG